MRCLLQVCTLADYPDLLYRSCEYFLLQAIVQRQYKAHFAQGDMLLELAIAQHQVKSFLQGIPKFGDIPYVDGGYYIDGNLHSGEIYAAIAEPIFDIDYAYGEFGGSISLTAANPIPEPASIALFGSGLLGFLGFRRKRF